MTIDASVLGDVLFEDTWFTAALGLVARVSLVAPAHLVSEMLSTIYKRYLWGRIGPAEATEFAQVALSLPVDRVPDESVAVSAMDIATTLRHSVYDCLYLAVALAEDAPLVTADRPLYDAAVAAGFGEYVVWIEDAA